MRSAPPNTLYPGVFNNQFILFTRYLICFRLIRSFFRHIFTLIIEKYSRIGFVFLAVPDPYLIYIVYHFVFEMSRSLPFYPACLRRFYFFFYFFRSCGVLLLRCCGIFCYIITITAVVVRSCSYYSSVIINVMLRWIQHPCVRITAFSRFRVSHIFLFHCRFFSDAVNIISTAGILQLLSNVTIYAPISLSQI